MSKVKLLIKSLDEESKKQLEEKSEDILKVTMKE